MHLIIDISNNNQYVDLSVVKRSGHIEGMWHKVSEGSSFTDKFWSSRRDRGRRLGLRVGGYHFARPGRGNPESQARLFVSALGKIHRVDLAPVLDLEVTDGVLPSGIVNFARRFNHEVHKLTGVWPIFYSYPAFIEPLHAQKVIGRGLWLASYGRNDGNEHPYSVPRPFKKTLAHQFTSDARVPGVYGRCDLSSAKRLVPILAYGWRGLPLL